MCFDDSEVFKRSLKNICMLGSIDSDLCLADCQQLIYCASALYKSCTSLQSKAIAMIYQKHNLVYKYFFNVIVFVLTLPVTSAWCERAHSTVDLIKSSIRASVASDRLEDLFIKSSEKCIVDSLDTSVIVDKYAITDRRLNIVLMHFLWYICCLVFRLAVIKLVAPF